MDIISKEMLLETGKKKGLKNREHIEKDYFQDVFLFNLFRKTNSFIFKGGTSLYKLYGLPRFSEDVDFSVIELDAESLENILRDALSNADIFRIKSAKKTKDSVLVKIECKGILTRSNSLRMDVNFKNRVIKGFDIKNYVSPYIDINPFVLRALKPEEIIAEKIHSIFMREKARDLFDLFFLMRLSKLDKKLVEEKLKIFGMKYDAKLLAKRISLLEGVWEKELKAFVLADLPEFPIVRDFVAKSMHLTS